MSLFIKKEVVVKVRRHLITIVIMCHIELPTQLHWLKNVTSTKKNQVLNQKLERPSITQIKNGKNYNSWE